MILNMKMAGNLLIDSSNTDFSQFPPSPRPDKLFGVCHLIQFSSVYHILKAEHGTLPNKNVMNF